MVGLPTNLYNNNNYQHSCEIFWKIIWFKLPLEISTSVKVILVFIQTMNHIKSRYNDNYSIYSLHDNNFIAFLTFSIYE